MLQVHLGRTEQSTLAGSFCSNTIPQPIISTNGFYIVFKADLTANGDGFRITYKTERIPGKFLPKFCHLRRYVGVLSVGEGGWIYVAYHLYFSLVETTSTSTNIPASASTTRPTTQRARETTTPGILWYGVLYDHKTTSWRYHFHCKIKPVSNLVFNFDLK